MEDPILTVFRMVEALKVIRKAEDVGEGERILIETVGDILFRAAQELERRETLRLKNGKEGLAIPHPL